MEFVQPIRDKQQIESMREFLKAKNLRDYCLFTMGVNSALRVSDLIGLKVGEVITPEGCLKNRVQLREKKTGKMKDFPLSAKAMQALAEYLGARKQVALDDPLFLSRNGGHVQRWQVWDVMNQAAQAVGIDENIGTHTLRKTFGYHAHKAGVPITTIQKLMNHSSPATTLAYIGITQDSLDEVYLTLDL